MEINVVCPPAIDFDVFQFLIGSMEINVVCPPAIDFDVFQFLIGSMEIFNMYIDNDVMKNCFNSL